MEVTWEAYGYHTGANIASDLDARDIGVRLRGAPRIHLRYPLAGIVVPSPIQPPASSR